MSSDSNPPGKDILGRLRNRFEPVWRSLVGWGKFYDDAKKVAQFLWSLTQNSFVQALAVILGITTAANHLTKPAPPDGPKPEALAPKPEPKAQQRPDITPAVPVEKPKCIATSLAKVRQLLTADEAAPANYRRELRSRQHCGWTLTVAKAPYQHTNQTWRVEFKTRDGLEVTAEFKAAPWVQENDIVLVGGLVGGYAAGNWPKVLLQNAWLVKR